MIKIETKAALQRLGNCKGSALLNTSMGPQNIPIW